MAENIVNAGAEDFEKEVLEADQPVVVDFWAEWCGPCKMLAPVLEEVAQEKADEVKVVKVDVDANQGLAREYGVQSIPYVVIFKDGEIIDEMVGFTGKDPLVEKIESL